RINNYKAGKSPLPGPREALRRWRERNKSKTPPPVDAWTELARRRGLDDDVAGVLREVKIDPAVAERLLDAGMDQFDLADLALEHGADGVHAADAMVRANVTPRVVLRTLAIARDIGVSRQVIELVNSGNLENLPGLRRFLEETANELENGQRGKYNQLM